ncbi:MAG TPA: phenylalanine--tRNA ligase beta subunit-related protein [Thermoanaerobaculia bacterium]|nr:phenylalanine--tRNA ligase beta subunit-related protein [Thermoanaerobaculia bacterium]
MRLRLDPSLSSAFPGVVLGVVLAREIENRGEAPGLSALLRSAEESVRETLAGVALAEHPRIAPWREAYRKFGVTPKRATSSIENLLRRVLRGEAVRQVNRLVDLYNVVSLRHLLPAGGEDLGRIEGDVHLTFAGPSEAPVTLLGEAEARPPHPGEVIYKDDLGTLCRRWNWKEADRTKLTEDTTGALLVLEVLPPAGPEDLEAALADLVALIARFCGGRLEAEVLDASRPELQWV